MSERLKGMPVWHKVFGVIETLALAACATGERIGFVTPTPEGTKTTTTEISPTVETGLGIDINEIPVTQESFGGSLLKGEIVDVNPADVATDILKNKILAEFQESAFNPHSDLLTDPKIYEVDVLGSNLIDQSGNKQPFFFVRPFDKDGKPTTFDIIDPSGVTYPAPFLFYTESDGKQFVPGGTGKEELGGRFLPVASYDAGKLRYFGLVSSVSGGNINLNLFMTYDSKTGITAYTDPYSGQTTSWQEEPDKLLNDMFFPKLASLISYRSIPEPISTSTPTPEALPPLTSFETLDDAQTFLESEEGAKWLPGIPTKEIELFPWNSSETWRMFSDLKSTGYGGSFVFLVPNTDGEKFSVIGVKYMSGKKLLSYIDRDGNPKAIFLKGPLDLRDFLGADFEKLFEKNVTIGPDLNYPNANSNGSFCTNRFRNPLPDMTEGFACSIDGKRGHYFQSPNIIPKNFDGGK